MLLELKNGIKHWGGISTHQFKGVKQTADGGYIVGGNSLANAGRDKSEDSRGMNDFWIIKLDAFGNKEWDKTIGSPSDDLLWSFQQTSDGGYILGGETQGMVGGDKSSITKGGGYDFWVVKLNAVGIKEWDKVIGGSGYDILRSLNQTTDGGYILGGLSASEASGDKSENSKAAGSTEPLAGYDYWVVKLNAFGTKEWDKTIGGNALDDFRQLQQTKDGGYILGGESFSNISGDKSENSKGGRDYWLVKLTGNGTKVWDKTYGGPSDEYCRVLQQTADGGYIFGGRLKDYWVQKLNAYGDREWEKSVGGDSFDDLSSLHQTIDGGYILGGSSTSNIGGDKSENCKGSYDYWVVKLSAPVMPDRTITTTQLAAPGYCTGSELAVSFTTKGTFNPGEVYKAQLSDASGSFVSPLTIGTSTTSPITASIPFRTPPGTGYKIRVVSSSEPIVIGSDNGLNFTISSTILGQTFEIIGPTEPCAQKQASYTILDPNDNHHFYWTVPSGWTIASGQGTSNITVTVGTTAGTVSVVGKNYCSIEIRGEVPVSPTVVPSQPDAITASATTICNGDTINFSTNPINQVYNVKTQYSWMLPSGWIILHGQGTNSITVKAGSASVSISVALMNQCGISPSRILNVTNSSPLAPTVTSASRCGSGSITLKASGAPLTGSYRWYTSSSGGTAIPNATASTYTTPVLTTTTTYYVSVVNSSCESVRVPVTATINPLPIVSAKATLYTIPVGESTTLTATGANTYVWSGTNFGGSTSATITVAPTITTTYRVTGTNANGCSSTASVTITVKQNQVITFPPLVNKVYGDAPFALNATSSSGLPVSYSILTGPATLSGNTLTLTGAGTVTVRALQTGNTAYLAATPVDQSFTVSPALTCTASGSILREYWANISGTSITAIPLTTTPTSTSQLTSLEAPTNIGSNYGQRIRGYVCAPQTGSYTFFIAGDDNTELWLSTDEQPANKRKLAGVTGWTYSKEWTKYASQKSAVVTLQANTKYYLEALHKEASGGDNVAVGWLTPGSSVIPSCRVRCFRPLCP